MAKPAALLNGVKAKVVLKHGTVQRTLVGTVRIFHDDVAAAEVALKVAQANLEAAKTAEHYELVNARETDRGLGADGLSLPDQTHEAIGFLLENLVSLDPLS